MFSRKPQHTPGQQAHFRTSRRINGASFVEVLICAFIFAVALLPLWQLSLENSISTERLKLRYVAQTALHNLMQSVWLNRQYAFNSGSKSLYFEIQAYQLQNTQLCQSPKINCQSSRCSAEELAMWDIQQFSCLLADHSKVLSLSISHMDGDIELAVLLNRSNSQYQLASSSLELGW